MSKTEIQDWLLSNQGFINKYNELLKMSVINQFTRIKNVSYKQDVDWQYMLMCSSMLAQSDKEKHQKIALRIAQFCIEDSKTNSVEKDAAAVILDILGNKPAIRLSEDKGLLQDCFTDRLPFYLFQDTIKRDIQNTLYLFDDKLLTVNSFQREFWEQVNKNDWISVSAPTSAGKSYIIEQWIIYYLHYNPNSTVVYIVPTRALISQVQIEIERVFKEYNFNTYEISVLPLQTVLKSDLSNILVYTQERFQILLSNGKPKIDLLIIDEAHKVGDNYRGVLLQHAVETAIDYNPECKVVYASPMTSNPEILLEDSPNNIKKFALTSECTTVNQNLMWISQKPRNTKEWNVTLINDANQLMLGEVSLEESPNTSSKKKALISYAICGMSQGNVIYANGAAEAEEIAKLLYGIIPDNNIEHDPDIINLIDLIRKIIHKEYLLSMYLKKGIAFHYGNIPLIIRNEIERLFNKGIINYLICTSTLIEGVNLPCRNLFLHGPQKGKGNPMNETDFWNLAGRAGRWGKDYQGNIFCIEATELNVWRNGPPQNRTKYPITKTTDRVIRDTGFISYLDCVAKFTDPPTNEQFEYVLSYLSSNMIRNGNIGNNKWASKFGIEKIRLIENQITSMLTDMSISNDVILNNPGVSPYAMNKLYGYFKNRTLIEKKPIEELLPVKVESNDALEIYIKILNRINSFLAPFVFGFGKRVRYLALLIINWMKGYSLAHIIAEREEYAKDKEPNYNLHKLIRDTMNDVEEVARFQAPKYLSCYVDVLNCFLKTQNRPDLLSEVTNMHILLEFGASNKTQLSLIGIGLSRSSAIAISDIIPFESLDEKQVVEWLKNNKWMTDDMPELIKKEVETVLNIR